MLVTKGSHKVLILTAATMSILLSGCAAKPNTQNQQNAPIKQQQVQQPVNEDNRIQIAKVAAAKIVELGSVKQTNVLVTKRNAYVAAVLKNDQQLTRDIEDQIANQVKATDPNIQNVYVSTNPDLVNRFNTYVQDVQQGRPVAGFVDQFKEIVARVFPTAK
ncbi:YhcN/YlaJ family sporulation lipoprotein [Paenibacillus alginolyticus]|uniref:YhcN/YlaJ family sporulation lipoprotein n=1 Tax=Paenibacillus alginolyticus TaxID=59839 RepID=A0ABT4GKV0_9BACL|nr:YhcN/YlaJ family sporulation lipoprotein [Paenibacillus alginolyticus]MCY9668951.1 YhcN/YlaJ family sporulation lipoprotein [Paenibacillus alginolyticus]MCY9696833.1 YhcN/YlaJ family sporulation lipoprotein [Paenibacillus alginolyticus]MEC0147653.1 YhcN/YlaJ family sporulation lipoprotein [Paenibacillus alginolyticus]